MSGAVPASTSASSRSRGLWYRKTVFTPRTTRAALDRFRVRDKPEARAELLADGRGRPQRRDGGTGRPLGRRGRLLDQPPLVASHRPTAAGVWVANLLSILGTIVAARALGPSEYGSVLLALAAVHAVSILLDVTLEEATNFYGNRALHDGDSPASGPAAPLAQGRHRDRRRGHRARGGAVGGPGGSRALASSIRPSSRSAPSRSWSSPLIDRIRGARPRPAGRPTSPGARGDQRVRLIGVIIAVQLGGRRRSRSRTCSAARREAWCSGGTRGARAGAGGHPSPARSRSPGRWAPGSWCVSGSIRA